MSNAYLVTTVIPEAHSDTIYAVTTTENYTITGSGDGRITLWDNNEQEPSPLYLKESGIGIHHLASTHDGSLLVAVGYDGVPLFYDLTTLKLKENDSLGELAGVKNAWAVAIGQLSPYIAFTLVSGSVVVYNLETMKKVSGGDSELGSSKHGFAMSIDVSPSGTYVACGYEHGGLFIYSIESGRLQYSFTGQPSSIRAVKFSPDGSYLAASGDSKVISIYTVRNGEHIMDLSGHEGWVFALAWDVESGGPDEDLFLLSSSFDGKVKLWSLDARSSVYTQTDSEKPLFGVSWLRKGWGKGVIGGFSKGFVTAGVDKSIRWYRSATSGK